MAESTFTFDALLGDAAALVTPGGTDRHLSGDRSPRTDTGGQDHDFLLRVIMSAKN